MDPIFLPQNTSALDRWNDGATRIVIWEFAFALIHVIVASSYFPRSSDFEHSHPPMTKTKLAVAVPTIFLPLASRIPSWQLFYHPVKIRNSLTGRYKPGKSTTKPSIFSFFQILQLTACSWLAGYDFVVFSARRFWFWFSFLFGFMLALTGTIYGLVGITRFFFPGPVRLTLPHFHAPANGEVYSNSTIEHCALERAYQQHLPNDATDPGYMVATSAIDHQLDDDYISLSQLQRTEQTYVGQQNIQDPEDDVTAREAGSSENSTRHRQIRSGHSPNSPVMPRFRWQEQVGARNGGVTFWGPVISSVTLLTWWMIYYKWLIRNSYNSPERLRLIILAALVPLAVTSLSYIFLIASLRKPLFALIFIGFCLTMLASIIWLAEFIYCAWCFFYYMRQLSVGFNFTSLVLILLSFGLTLSHVALLRCSVKMEWTPGYSSIANEYRLWKERRGEPGASAEEHEDEVS